MKSVVFIGHGECFGINRNQLTAEIVKCIESGTTHFLSGGQGDYDILCAQIVFKLKREYPQIKNILVIPYLTFNVFNKQIFDEIIFPEGFEKYHYKSAIPMRNKFMIKNSSIAICYINHGWGNAVKTYEYAKKNGLEIINLSVYKNELLP